MRRFGVPVLALALLFGGARASEAATPASFTLTFFTGMQASPGLCFPGLVDVAGACVVDPGLLHPPSAFAMGMPSGVMDECRLTVVYNDESVHEDPCSLWVEGLLRHFNGVGPSCGSNSGSDSGALTNQVTADGDTFSLGMSWFGTVGGTAPITGLIGGRQYRGILQLRPVNQNCMTTSATHFVVFGFLQSI